MGQAMNCQQVVEHVSKLSEMLSWEGTRHGQHQCVLSFKKQDWSRQFWKVFGRVKIKTKVLVKSRVHAYVRFKLRTPDTTGHLTCLPRTRVELLLLGVTVRTKTAHLLFVDGSYLLPEMAVWQPQSLSSSYFLSFSSSGFASGLENLTK